MTRVIITGGSGLVGHELIQQLVREDVEVICLGRRAPEASAGQVEFVEADLGSALDCSTLPDRADAVVHLAQSAQFNEFPTGAGDMLAVNVSTPASLLDWARKAQVHSFVHASSGGLYGSGPTPFKETDALQIPKRLAFYLSTKHAIEKLAAAYSDYFAVAALRYFFVYGERQRPTMLLPRLVRNVAAGNAITLQGKDGMCINPVHVSDAASAAFAAIKNKAAGVFNVAGPDVVNIRQIAESIGQHTCRKPVFEFVAGEAGNLVADTSAMLEHLCAATVSISAGLEGLCRAATPANSH